MHLLPASLFAGIRVASGLRLAQLNVSRESPLESDGFLLRINNQDCDQADASTLGK
jgi:hypothetical protein